MPEIRSVALLLTATLLLPIPADAQETVPQEPSLFHLDLTVGADVGPQTFPSLLTNGCYQDRNSTDTRATMGGALRLAAEVLGPLGIEVRAGVYGGPGPECAHPNDPGRYPVESPVPLSYDQTVYSNRASPSLDARLRLALGEDAGPVITLGRGFLSGGPKYLTGSVGYRWGTGVRWGLDLDMTGYELLWRNVGWNLHADPENPAALMASPLRTRYFDSWHLGFGVRGVVEVGLL